jgi:hypothetical protein
MGGAAAQGSGGDPAAGMDTEFDLEVDTDLVLTTDAGDPARVENRRMPDYQDIRQDMRATIEARRDLGPDYEAALVESFVERLDESIARRVRAEMHATGAQPYPSPHPPPRKGGNGSIPIALGSMGLGIPLTAIAAESSGTLGLLLVWGGIVAINLAHALGRLRGRD